MPSRDQVAFHNQQLEEARVNEARRMAEADAQRQAMARTQMSEQAKFQQDRDMQLNQYQQLKSKW